jgi:hypothetical protein
MPGFVEAQDLDTIHQVARLAVIQRAAMKTSTTVAPSSKFRQVLQRKTVKQAGTPMDRPIDSAAIEIGADTLEILFLQLPFRPAFRYSIYDRREPK